MMRANPYVKTARDLAIRAYNPDDVEDFLPDSLELTTTDNPWRDTENYPAGCYAFPGSRFDGFASKVDPEPEPVDPEVENRHRRYVLTKIHRDMQILAWRLGPKFDAAWAGIYKPGRLDKASSAQLDQLAATLKAEVDRLYAIALES